MDHFTVTSDRLAGHEQGDEITMRSLGDANLDALIEAGHLKHKHEKTGAMPDAAEKPKGERINGR